MSLNSKLCVLKRYAPKNKKLRIKKSKVESSSNLRLVIDDQSGVHEDSNVAREHIYIDSDLDDELGEDSPVIAQIIDERAEHLKLADDLLELRKWKSIESPMCVDSKNKFADIKQEINASFDSCRGSSGLKLEIGSRLSRRKLKAAAMATEYCRLMSQSKPSRGRNITIDAEAIPALTPAKADKETGGRAVEGRPVCANHSDSDSDISVDRVPQESARCASTFRSRAPQTANRESTCRSKFSSQTGNGDPSGTVDPTARYTQAAQMNADEERAKKFRVWSRGVAQVRDIALYSQQLVDSKDKPLARYKDDVELDVFLRRQEREGDPMAQFLESQSVPSEMGNKPAVKRTCRYPATPNRFNIAPGCRWDGVDRSSGFELKLIDAKAGKLSIAEHAYKWKVEDM